MYHCAAITCSKGKIQYSMREINGEVWRRLGPEGSLPWGNVAGARKWGEAPRGKMGKGDPDCRRPAGLRGRVGQVAGRGCGGSGHHAGLAGPMQSGLLFREQHKVTAAFKQGGWHDGIWAVTGTPGCWEGRWSQSRQELEWGRGPRRLLPWSEGAWPPSLIEAPGILLYWEIIKEDHKN